MSIVRMLIFSNGIWMQSLVVGQTVPEFSDNADYISVQEQVIDAAFPLNARESGIFALGFRSYRLYPSNETGDLEYSVVLEWVRNRNVTGTSEFDLLATVTTAIETPVSNQILRVLDGEEVPVESTEILDHVRLQEWKISEESCAGLRRILHEFETLAIPSVMFDYLESGDGIRMPTIALHSWTHEIVVTRLGLTVGLSFHDQQFSRGTNWMRNARMVLDECIADSP